MSGQMANDSIMRNGTQSTLKKYNTIANVNGTPEIKKKPYSRWHTSSESYGSHYERRGNLRASGIDQVFSLGGQ
jgi:hypothetical protein